MLHDPAAGTFYWDRESAMGIECRQLLLMLTKYEVSMLSQLDWVGTAEHAGGLPWRMLRPIKVSSEVDEWRIERMNYFYSGKHERWFRINSFWFGLHCWIQ